MRVTDCFAEASAIVKLREANARYVNETAYANLASNLTHICDPAFNDLFIE